MCCAQTSRGGTTRSRVLVSFVSMIQYIPRRVSFLPSRCCCFCCRDQRILAHGAFQFYNHTNASNPIVLEDSTFSPRICELMAFIYLPFVYFIAIVITEREVSRHQKISQGYRQYIMVSCRKRPQDHIRWACQQRHFRRRALPFQ